MGSAGLQRDLRLVYRAAGLFSRFKVSRWLHLFAPSRVAAPVGTAASSMLGHPIHWLAPFVILKRNLLALLLVFFFLLSFSALYMYDLILMRRALHIRPSVFFLVGWYDASWLPLFVGDSSYEPFARYGSQFVTGLNVLMFFMMKISL